MCLMPPIDWVFAWEQNRAVGKAGHGTYVVARLASGEWEAAFTSVDTQPYRRTKRPVDPRSMTFTSVAAAIRACHRHAERYSPDASNRFTVVTPLPQ
jgi:hypothetical protein